VCFLGLCCLNGQVGWSILVHAFLHRNVDILNWILGWVLNQVLNILGTLSADECPSVLKLMLDC